MLTRTRTLIACAAAATIAATVGAAAPPWASAATGHCARPVPLLADELRPVLGS